jgi:hypothetical protein
MSSPSVSTFQPGIVGSSIARLVLPQALGNARRDVVHLLLGRGELEDQHVLGEPALVAAHDAGDAQRVALLAQQRVAAVAGAEDQISRVSGKCEMYFVSLHGHGDVVLARLERRADRVQARDERGVLAHARRAPRCPSRAMIRIEATTYGLSVISTPNIGSSASSGPCRTG